jgi:5-methylcytosine-specific restriction endonuclease McrA
VAGTNSQLGRSARLDQALRRDGNRCRWCGREFGALVTPTTDHLIPRIKGGPSWLENEVAACRRCNSDRGHRSPAAWLDECEQRGWRPDRAAVADQLTGLAAAIAERGGQRRARSYLEGQLRRLT